MKELMKTVAAKAKSIFLTVWHVPAVESVVATVVIRWLGLIGIPAVASTAIYEAAKALIG